jgi:hypothetical protein
VDPVRCAAARRPRRARELRLGDADAAELAHPELRRVPDDPLLLEPLLRLRRSRARADDGGARSSSRGRRFPGPSSSRV